MKKLDKVINGNSLYLLLVFSLTVFSLNGTIVSTYGQLSPGNNSITTQLDSAQKSPDNGQLIATPGPSENDLGITKEQSNINNEEDKEDQPQIPQQKQDKEEETSDNSDEVDGDNVASKSEQEDKEEEQNIDDGNELKDESDEEENSADDSKKNDDDTHLEYDLWVPPFP